MPGIRERSLEKGEKIWRARKPRNFASQKESAALIHLEKEAQCSHTAPEPADMLVDRNCAYVRHWKPGKLSYRTALTLRMIGRMAGGLAEG